MTTIRDIAKHANVSIATVSRVLNNNEKVNESIRDVLLQAAETLNYPPEKPKGQTTDQPVGDRAHARGNQHQCRARCEHARI